jgi:hypothetical protein
MELHNGANYTPVDDFVPVDDCNMEQGELDEADHYQADLIEAEMNKR